MIDNYTRYARQLIFPGIGQEGQQKLLKAHVVLVGCGAGSARIDHRPTMKYNFALQY